MSEAWTESWNASKYEVGRAMHEGWKRQKIANGFADHPLAIDGTGLVWQCRHCELPFEQHHADMIDWDDLSSAQQAINYEGGREGFRMGFEAGRKREDRDLDPESTGPWR